MGRGRAKAKQTKVARALKYSTTATDLERLQRELSAAETAERGSVSVDGKLDGDALSVDEDDAEDPYVSDPYAPDAGYADGDESQLTR